eukprot:PITA_08541
MGNGYGKISGCFRGQGRKRERHDIAVLISNPLDEGLGHSFCYIRPNTSATSVDFSENISSVKLNHISDSNSNIKQYASSKVHSDECRRSSETTTFKSISGASVSANTSTPLTTAPPDQYNSFAYVKYDRAAAFESTTSFGAIPLQPVPRGLSNSGPLVSSGGFASGPLERGFLSGPLERGFLSGPLERGFASGPLDRGYKSGPMESTERSGPLGCRRKLRRNHSVSRALKSVSGPLKKVMSRTISKSVMLSVSRSLRGSLVRNTSSVEGREWMGGDVTSTSSSGDLSLDDTSSDSFGSENLHWAQGKAGEDRVHVVVSEEHGWLFVGIYDGFNGPDAPDYLLSNLYTSIYRELRGLIWDCPGLDKPNTETDSKQERESEELHCQNCDQDSTGSVRAEGIGNGDQCCTSYSHEIDNSVDNSNSCPRQHMQGSRRENGHGEPCRCEAIASSNPPTERTLQGYDKTTSKSKTKQVKGRLKGMSRKWKENQRKWKHEWNQERLELDRILKEDLDKNRHVEDQDGGLDHSEVLKALARALSKTEEAYLEMADKAVAENPELALMGSCVLVMLMKGEDVYVMNVGDSRAILAKKLKPDLGEIGSISQAVGESRPCRDLERISEETSHDLEAFDDCSHDMDLPGKRPTLGAVQLSLDHSTGVEEEVQRIKAEHADDVLPIMNDRVKGTLKVTRAFGAGFLKQPKWNDALLEVFRIDFVGTVPYITCTPALRYHRLGPEDHYLILSSDGLYQYFTNEEVVNHVEWFMSSCPDGDPAQHLVEEVLFRAAKKAGMDFHELLDIPQGDRRKYHDDVSVMVISLEGRIWRSQV